MDQFIAVDKVLRDLIKRKIIFEEDNRMRVYLDALWVAGWEHYRRYEAHHDGNVRAVIYYDRNGKKLGDYPSVSEASRKLKIPRKTMQTSLSHPKHRMRNGHYFRYIDNGDDQHQQE